MSYHFQLPGFQLVAFKDAVEEDDLLWRSQVDRSHFWKVANTTFVKVSLVMANLGSQLTNLRDLFKIAG